MTDFKTLSKFEVKELYLDWCRWNAKELEEREFVSRYSISPQAIKFYLWDTRVYGMKLKTTWKKFLKERRKK